MNFVELTLSDLRDGKISINFDRIESFTANKIGGCTLCFVDDGDDSKPPCLVTETYDRVKARVGVKRFWMSHILNIWVSYILKIMSR
jgi:hypothetical protein